jgi:hypothetical protein
MKTRRLAEKTIPLEERDNKTSYQWSVDVFPLFTTISNLFAIFHLLLNVWRHLTI